MSVTREQGVGCDELPFFQAETRGSVERPAGAPILDPQGQVSVQAPAEGPPEKAISGSRGVARLVPRCLLPEGR